MEHKTPHHEKMTGYPTHKVVATIDHEDDAHAAIQALVASGVPQDEIDVLAGEEGIQRLDITGKHHGLLGRLNRVLLQFADSEPEIIKQHEADLEAGRYVLIVPAADPGPREKIRQLLKSHNAHFINYFGTWAVESLDG